MQNEPSAQPIDSIAAASPAVVSIPEPPILHKIFIGPNGLRAGWRLLIFIVILRTLVFLNHRLLQALHVTGFGIQGNTLTPESVIFFEFTTVAILAIATLIMARVEKRPFGVYGLPWTRRIFVNLPVGAVWGFLAISGTMGAIYLFHGFSINGMAAHGATLAAASGAWLLAFIGVGLSEEFTFRGYGQFTLTTGMGFWPSAFLFSALFALAHASNGGETIYGLLAVVVVAMFLCLTLQRTGNLWWAVGFHLGWDWGETFFYGVPDSGMLPSHSFLSSSLHGRPWITGGTVGPEGSFFALLSLVVVALLFNWRYREVRYRAV